MDSSTWGLDELGLLEAVLAATLDIIIVVDRDAVIRYANEACEKVLGYSPEQWINRSAIGLIHPDDRGPMAARLGEVFSDPDVTPEPLALRAAHAEGHWVSLEASGIELVEHPNATGIVVVLRDVTLWVDAERRLQQSRAKLNFAVTHDPLTGLPNRVSLMERLEALGRSVSPDGMDSYLVMAKIGNFDELRDRYGVEEAEAIVQNLSRSIRAEVRPVDLVAVDRIGEFVVLTEPSMSATDVEKLAGRLVALAKEPLSRMRHRVEVVIGVGVTVLAPDKDAADMFDQVGVAARWGCTSGAAEPIVFGDSLSEMVDEQRRIAVEIELALAGREFELYYQPIVDARTGRVDGFEGLLRWNHPDDGVVAAGTFLPAVEGTPAIIDIGNLVLAEGCRQLARWQRRFGDAAPSLALNISALQLRQHDFADSVSRELALSGADGTGLCIELTETHALERGPRAAEELDLLREMGVKIALDDFGTGYSSLHHLQEIKADILKIDRAFIERLGIDDGATAIVRAAIDLGAAFGMKTIAEGVTTPEELRDLVAMGCNQIQGWLIAPAVIAAEAEAMIDSKSPSGYFDQSPMSPITTATSYECAPSIEGSCLM